MHRIITALTVLLLISAVSFGQQFTFTFTGEDTAYGVLAYTTEFNAELENLSGVENPITLLFDRSQHPIDWQSEVCLEIGCLPPISQYTDTLPPYYLEQVIIDITPFSFGIGTFTIDAYSELDTTITASQSFTVICPSFIFAPQSEIIQEGQLGEENTFVSMLQTNSTMNDTIMIDFDDSGMIAGWDYTLYINGVEITSTPHSEILMPGVPIGLEVYITPQSIGDGCLTVSAYSTAYPEIVLSHTFIVYYGTVVEKRTATAIPQMITINSAYPNPFNPTVTVDFILSHDSPIDITIYNIMGERIGTESLGSLPQGAHQFHWKGLTDEGIDCPSGIYHIRFQTGEFSQTAVVVKLK